MYNINNNDDATKVKVALTPEYFDRQSDETAVGAARKGGSNEGSEEERKEGRERDCMIVHAHKVL